MRTRNVIAGFQVLSRGDEGGERRLADLTAGAGAAAAALAGLVPAEVLAQGCAMCKTALEGAGDPTAQAFNWGILLLLSVPYLVVGSVGGWLCYAYWRGRAPRRYAQVLELVPDRKEGDQ